MPQLASFILTHDLNGEIQGLNEFAPDHPPVKTFILWFSDHGGCRDVDAIGELVRCLAIATPTITTETLLIHF
ncbi:hypothetical protein ACT691_08605 [Vibrio metschnikovii]